jgi:long-chain acyl-CoA synthetase
MTTGNLDLDTFPKLLVHHSSERGERPAIREKSRGIWRTVTWRELAEEAAALAAAASARGMQRGAHVALLGDNRPRLYAAMCAAQWLGAIVVPLYQDATADEIASSIESAKVTHVFAENQEQVDKLLEILPRCPRLDASSTTRTAACATTSSASSSATTPCCSRAGNSPPKSVTSCKPRLARGSGQDSRFRVLYIGHDRPCQGRRSHPRLADRSRARRRVDGRIEGYRRGDGLSSAGWIGQNLFGYVQPMVVGYCICCPESSDTMLADMREMGPTYFLATPRVLETLAKQVSLRMEEAGGFNQGLYRYCMAVARRVSARTLAGEPFRSAIGWCRWRAIS